jgi:hypothetical protein
LRQNKLAPDGGPNKLAPDGARWGKNKLAPDAVSSLKNILAPDGGVNTFFQLKHHFHLSSIQIHNSKCKMAFEYICCMVKLDSRVPLQMEFLIH